MRTFNSPGGASMVIMFEVSPRSGEGQKRGQNDGGMLRGFCALCDAPNWLAAESNFVPWIKAPIQGHYSERDDGIPVADVRAFESALRGRGGQADFFLYDVPSHFHSFHEALYDAAAASLAWNRTIKFLRSYVPQN
jgi:dienelactone hydrolase